MKRVLALTLLVYCLFGGLFGMHGRLNYDGLVVAMDSVGGSAESVISDFNSLKLFAETLELFDPAVKQYLRYEKSYPYVVVPPMAENPEDYRTPDEEYITIYWITVIPDGDGTRETTHLVGTFKRNVMRYYPVEVDGELKRIPQWVPSEDVTGLVDLLYDMEHDAPSDAFYGGFQWLYNWFLSLYVLIKWAVLVVFDIFGVTWSLIQAVLYLLGF